MFEVPKIDTKTILTMKIRLSVVYTFNVYLHGNTEFSKPWVLLELILSANQVTLIYS